MSKISTERKEIHTLSVKELEERIEVVRRELLSTRLKHVTSPVKDKNYFKKARRTIARLMTALRIVKTVS